MNIDFSKEDKDNREFKSCEKVSDIPNAEEKQKNQVRIKKEEG